MTTRLSISRYEFPELIDERRYHSAIEVGVNLGQFSYHLLKYSKLWYLLSIDAYKGKYKSAMKGAVSLLQPYTETGRCKLWRKSSVEAAKELSVDGRWYDFVYIDACHDEQSVTADLEAWSTLVRPGGMLCGHDYVDQHPGVIHAVNKFSEKTGWEFSLTREAWASWVFLVP